MQCPWEWPSPSRSTVRLAIVLLAVSSLVVGVWQMAAPRAFYDGFPDFGQSWVSVDGPYNEHLPRDVGGVNRALAVVALAARLRPTPLLARRLGPAGRVTAVQHLAHHLIHLALVRGLGDQLAQTLSLLVSALLPATIPFKAERFAGSTTAVHSSPAVKVAGRELGLPHSLFSAGADQACRSHGSEPNRRSPPARARSGRVGSTEASPGRA